jgi:hypothetical protein
MTEPPGAPDQTTLYREPGGGWPALLCGPAFALVGYLTELTTGGSLHTVAWVGVAAGLSAITAPWVYARRRFLAVRLTRRALWQGREELMVGRIAAVNEVGTPIGARVLGGGWAVPRRYDELPLRLHDGTVVLAWARDAEALRSALARVVDTEDAQS